MGWWEEPDPRSEFKVWQFHCRFRVSACSWTQLLNVHEITINLRRTFTPLLRKLTSFFNSSFNCCQVLNQALRFSFTSRQTTSGQLRWDRICLVTVCSVSNPSGRRVSCRSCQRAAQRRCSRPEARRRTAIRRDWPYRPAAWWETTGEHKDKAETTYIFVSFTQAETEISASSLTSVTMVSMSSVKTTRWLDETPSCCSIWYFGVDPIRTISMDWQAMYTWNTQITSVTILPTDTKSHTSTVTKGMWSYTDFQTSQLHFSCPVSTSWNTVQPGNREKTKMHSGKPLKSAFLSKKMSVISI